MALHSIIANYNNNNYYYYYYYYYYWRASEASKTLTGVTQLKIGDVCLLASKRSERDSSRGG